MKILGIDPGLQCTGFGVIESEGHRLRYIASGTIKTTHLPTRNLPQRIKAIFDGVCQVAKHYEVHQSAIEIVFVNNNPKSSLLLGQARGACLSALVFHDLPVTEYTALQMKKSVAGHGKAQKAQVQEMVKRLLNLDGLPGTDAADALGLAITHAQVAWVQSNTGLASQLSSTHTGHIKRGRSR
jgi:crossover junction endodeoxyribonuclease RuvC